ncbi:MAG: metallophosphoesterase [Halioglobus sp.]|nr:metallophosphoesterase [Halioglobus sp.]
MGRIFYIVLAAVSLQFGCSSSDSDIVPSSVSEYGLTEKPYTSLQQVWVPNEPSPEVRAKMDDGTFTVYQHQQYVGNGLGARLENGLPWVEHVELAPSFTSQGTQRSSLAYILVIADPQIIDEESPIRMDGYAKVYRPGGQLTPQVFEAHIRTARRISDKSSRPFDFTIIAGDLTDTSQKNELDWMITALNGGVIDPDSGVDDDPVPGPGNDYNDPFIAVGIDSPWYAALGNHDVLHVGGFGLIDSELREAAQGDHLFTDSNFSKIWGGYVAGNTADHRVIFDPAVITPSDPDRLPLNEAELLKTLHDAGGAPAGHGLSLEDVAAHRGYYSVYPVAGKPIKMIVLDSTDAAGNSLGSMDQIQFAWLHEELISAADRHELVIVVSHHRLRDFAKKSEVSAASIRNLLVSSNNVILHLTGHGHRDRKTLQTVNGEDGFWELMTTSTIDFPMQSRILELVDEHNGYLSIYVTNVGHNSAAATLASKARQLAAGKLAFGTTFFDGDTVTFWAREVQAQNLLLRVALPVDVSRNLATISDWPKTIESVHTLSHF